MTTIHLKLYQSLEHRHATTVEISDISAFSRYQEILKIWAKIGQELGTKGQGNGQQKCNVIVGNVSNRVEVLPCTAAPCLPGAGWRRSAASETEWLHIWNDTIHLLSKLYYEFTGSGYRYWKIRHLSFVSTVENSLLKSVGFSCWGLGKFNLKH